ncbi:MAG TPA: PQQ-dependent sugar dehydrogenase [Dongiaceae bacterium]|nr:PQQ-dependent sugar dehydrogenase [Dongiaceae bacterium]
MSSPRSAPGLVAASLFALALAALHAEAGGGLQAALTLEPVLSGLSSPVFVTHASDGSGRLFVLEQPGQIKVLQPGAAVPTVFLDIRAKVAFGGERGLLGLAFHPDYETNRRFFVDYTRLPDGATVIAEYHASVADPNVADPAETVLLTIAQPFANHNGGMIAFGPDGDLYIGMGDGGSANDPGARAQNIDELLGKILRLDVDHPASATQLYSSPADNPFAGAIAGRDEIYAWGFRNPWRFSFDRQTGALMVGDVGQSAREEVDVVVKGGNYGWRTFEGTLCTGLDPPPCNPAPFVMPIAEYDHSGGRCSITGGSVYRGSRGTFPAGAYLFGDYCSGDVYLIDGGQGALEVTTGRNISSFGEDQDGELYLVDLGGAVLRFAGVAPCIVSIAPASLAFSAAGGTGAVNVTAGEGCDWSVSTDDPWITITDAGSGTGDGAVHYSVATNTGDRSRTGSVRIGSQSHVVTQQAPAPCAVEVTPKIVLAGPLGGPGTLTVKGNGACFWSATSSAPWITITGGGSAAGSGVVQYRIDPLPRRTARIGTIRIGGRTIAVLQRAVAF